MEALLERVCMAPVIRHTRQPDPRQGKGMTKLVWMLLLDEGGWWTAAEVVARLHVHAPWMRQQLRMMAIGGLVEHRTHETIDGERLTQYSVSWKCKQPRDVTIEEIWRLLQATAAKG